LQGLQAVLELAFKDQAELLVPRESVFKVQQEAQALDRQAQQELVLTEPLVARGWLVAREHLGLAALEPLGLESKAQLV
jgi:hypothetical protein